MTAMRLSGHVTQSGRPKRPFPSAREAIKFSLEHGLRVRIYRCTTCGYWHFASKGKH